MTTKQDYINQIKVTKNQLRDSSSRIPCLRSKKKDQLKQILALLSESLESLTLARAIASLEPNFQEKFTNYQLGGVVDNLSDCLDYDGLIKLSNSFYAKAIEV